MKKIIPLLFVLASLTAKADISVTLTWAGNFSTASGTMIIDETVCLVSNSCGSGTLSALGISPFNITITTPAPCLSTYSIAPSDQINLFFPSPPNLTMDLVPQALDINVQSNSNGIVVDGPFTFLSFFCGDTFTLVSAIPSPVGPPPPPPNTIPTLGQWGIILFTLLLLTMSTVAIVQREAATVATSRHQASFSFRQLPFHRDLFLRLLAGVLVAAFAVFGVAIAAFGYELTSADIPGTLICAPIFAYLLSLAWKK